MKLLLLLLILPWKILTWNDFKGRVPVVTNLDASSNVALSWDYICVDTVAWSINCHAEFNTKLSFTRTNAKSTLKHEQGHLDITEIYARKSNAFTKNKRMSVLDFEIFRKKLDKEWQEVDDRYDNETNHSLNITEQERWNKWIQEQLKK